MQTLLVVFGMYFACLWLEVLWQYITVTMFQLHQCNNVANVPCWCRFNTVFVSLASMHQCISITLFQCHVINFNQSIYTVTIRTYIQRTLKVNQYSDHNTDRQRTFHQSHNNVHDHNTRSYKDIQSQYVHILHT